MKIGGTEVEEVEVFRFPFVVSLCALTALAAVPLSGLLAAEEPEFTEEYLEDPENIALGKELFREQCSKCHGRGSYPGKAPKLYPAKLTPDEIYLKVTYGFGRMPAWEHIYSDEERKALTAYMKSSIFSN